MEFTAGLLAVRTHARDRTTELRGRVCKHCTNIYVRVRGGRVNGRSVVNS